MTRYFLYLAFIVMLVNTILFVPRILFMDRFNGAISAILISIPYSSTLVYTFCKVMRKFPGKGIPEIFLEYLPNWIAKPFLVFLGLMWFCAGAMSLTAFATVAKRFIIPDMPSPILLGCLTFVTVWAASQNTRSVLYFTEISFILILPATILILIKSFWTEEFNWNAVLIFTDYIWQVPSFSAICAATYVCVGYVQLSLYNRAFKNDKKLKLLWLVPITGFFVLLTTFFIPIGILGTSAIEDYNYPWVSTADSLRMEYGFVERILFTYLLLYLIITLLMASTTWHVAAEFLKGCFPKLPANVEQNFTPRITVGILISLSVITLWYGSTFNEYAAFRHALIWMKLRFFSEIALVATVLFIGIRRQNR
jgi:hypothetical protein